MQLKRDIPRGKVRGIGASIVGAMAIATACAVWAAQPVPGIAATTPEAGFSNAQDNDGLFITLKVAPGNAYIATPETLPVDTSWLKPGQRLPAGINWQDGAGAPRIGVGLVYGVERDASGGMTALISLAEKDNVEIGVRPSMDGAQIIRVPVVASAVSHYERVVGRRGTRLQFDVRRARGPCHGEAAGQSLTFDGGEFQCYPGLKPLAIDEPSPETRVTVPVYPQEAIRKNIDGEVRLNVLVTRDGTVKDANVVSSTPSGVFDAAALRAVRNWRLKPRYDHGVAVEEWRRVPVSFGVN